MKTGRDGKAFEPRRHGGHGGRTEKNTCLSVRLGDLSASVVIVARSHRPVGAAKGMIEGNVPPQNKGRFAQRAGLLEDLFDWSDSLVVTTTSSEDSSREGRRSCR